MVFRYQEWTDGLNFNVSVIITLQLCLYLRHNLQVCVKPQTTMTSYFKINASSKLFATQSTNTLVSIGFYPRVVVMDLKRKGVFSFEGMTPLQFHLFTC